MSALGEIAKGVIEGLATLLMGQPHRLVPAHRVKTWAELEQAQRDLQGSGRVIERDGTLRPARTTPPPPPVVTGDVRRLLEEQDTVRLRKPTGKKT